jgi:hypothetical protein
MSASSGGNVAMREVAKVVMGKLVGGLCFRGR